MMIIVVVVVVVLIVVVVVVMLVVKNCPKPASGCRETVATVLQNTAIKSTDESSVTTGGK
jgi:uncharacterized protein YpmB